MHFFSRVVNVKAYSFQGFPITYELTSEAGKPQNDFAINTNTGVVDLLRTLDYERDPSEYHLIVKAKENGQIPHTSTVNVRLFNSFNIFINVRNFPFNLLM